MIPDSELKAIVATQQEILQLLKSRPPLAAPAVEYIPAKEFMERVHIKRTKFDLLVKTHKIKIIKKLRKIYVPVTEIERYFREPGM